MPCALNDFCHIRPHHDVPQETILDWIAETHARAANRFENRDVEAFRKELREKILQLGVGKERIERRGIHISDLFQEDWENMEIYPVGKHPSGRGFSERSYFYDREVSRIFERFYPDERELPAHLIHVTCTGYVAPSPAQKLVSLRNAGMKTTVTHAYHMGCYGSIPAIRMASGFASPIDIVHTEICSLHMHPLKHTKEQLMVQSLFGDGFIKYSFNSSTPMGPHLKILGLLEETIPDSSHGITWQCEDHGMGMTLSKEVPVLISRSIEGYFNRLCQTAGLDYQSLAKDAFFAIHPGGPKIVQQIKDQLNFKPHQVEHSMQVLKDCGNMSSATLPHIWERMLQDPKVPKKARIISVAFGPGLISAGGLFEKGG